MISSRLYKLFHVFLSILLFFEMPICSATVIDNLLKSGEDHLKSGNISKRVGSFKVGGKYRIKGRLYTPTVNFNYSEEGMASWYGGRLFHNKKTANGATYDQDFYLVAHRTLHMPSVVRITNLANGLSVKAIVADRGPYKNTLGKKRRIIDVSKRVAKDLEFL